MMNMKRFLDVDKLDLEIMDSMDGWISGNATATEAIIAICSTVDKALRKYEYTGFAYQINGIVNGHINSVKNAVMMGSGCFLTPVKHIMFLCKNGCYPVVQGDKVITDDGTDITDFTWDDILGYLGY